MKKVSTQLAKRIDEINALIQQANELDCMVYTYGGATHP
jgi:hypothetical protein